MSDTQEETQETQTQVAALISDIFGDADDDDDGPVQRRRGGGSAPQNSSSSSSAAMTTEKDIFGDSDDDDDDALPVSKGTKKGTNKSDDIFGDDDDDDLLDSDEEDAHAAKRSRLSKGGKLSSKNKSERKSKSSDGEDDEMGGSGDNVQKKKHKSKDKEKDKDKKKKKKNKAGKEGSGADGGSSSSSKIGKRTSSRQASSGTTKKSASGANGEGKAVDDGDEYDSGEEVVRTKEDDAFIDEDDEMGDLVKEYEEDEQNFNDLRPDGSQVKKKRKADSDGDGSSSSKKLDPLSQTLSAMKKPKKAAMTDAEKQKIVTDLLARMDKAARDDDRLFQLKQPATNKLQLLKVVQQIVSMRDLHNTLLDYDILAVMKDWIEPKDASTLPSLQVRTAVYEMLYKLPCATDHLKRAAPGKQPIGTTIVALRKHKMETVENKRRLKDLMEKWCRPIYGKSVDARSSNNAELIELSQMRQVSSREDDKGVVGFDALMSGNAGNTEAYGGQRVRTPYSSGFVYTVQPESKVITKRNAEDEVGDTRSRLLKRMKEVRGGGVVGKKQNPRAVDMSMNGRGVKG